MGLADIDNEGRPLTEGKGLADIDSDVRPLTEGNVLALLVFVAIELRVGG